ncbi:HAMP domain-containing histidine kinase [Clostridioides mangenotii]|uniref:HAMP domain-containing sensor histidine kinase n=1 Tax=Metaclostridioides mangenotii TaxID=1540 RepID=UPI001C128325|nr:HAMP domain-containing sensor histidine kinase [Clostridioides mangenotii]MBU5306198.1 HAMP domain-containing histidine kinase [Clostridioides mangenotii]
MKTSIANRIMIFFLGIIFFVIFSIVTFNEAILQKNNELIIKNEVNATAKSINIYIEQYIKLKDLQLNNASFAVEAMNISKDLSYRLENTVFIYSAKGKLMYPYDQKINEPNDDISMKKAQKGKLSYTIKHHRSNTRVYVSYPIINNSKIIGIIRFENDYSKLYRRSNDFLQQVVVFSIFIFILSIIIAYFISNQLTKPLVELSKKTREIAMGNFDIDIDINSDDELGKLSKDFKTMVEKIQFQINIIKNDRDNIKKLSEKQKKFFDNVTHELKTPMTSIIGYSEVLKDNQFTDIKFFNKGINRIISEATRLNRMIVQLIEISKNSKDDFDYDLKKIDLSNILINMCDDMVHKARKFNIRLDPNIEENINIIANEDKIKEMIINIIDNSIKYGKIDSIIFINVWKDSGFANIVVRDSGEGIAENELEKILSPFYRISKLDCRELGSTGLGLAIVKSIVEDYNGEIFIISKVGIGTEVLIKIPTIEWESSHE